MLFFSILTLRHRFISKHCRVLHSSSSSPPPPPSPLLSASTIKYDNDTVLATLSSYSSDWTRALDFFHWVSSAPGFSHSSATLTAAVDILGKHFELDRAWSLLSSHPSLPDRSTFRTLINRLAAARLVPDAILP